MPMSIRNWLIPSTLALAACSGAAPPPGAPQALPEPREAAAPAALTDPASGASCAGQGVRVTRDGFNLVVDGDCGEVVVTGSNGAINVDRAASIRVEGSNVTVLNEHVGKVVVSGHDNVLNLTIAGPLAIEGDRNMVLAREIETVAFAGRDNTVNPDNAPALDDKGTGNRLL